MSFKKLLKQLGYSNCLVSKNKHLVIQKISSEDVLGMVGGGYGEYMNEPQTLGCYLIFETSLAGKTNPKWWVETTFGDDIVSKKWLLAEKRDVNF